MPFGAQLAGLPEDKDAILVGVLAQDDADPPLAEQHRHGKHICAMGPFA
jgi:hypothetical protein